MSAAVSLLKNVHRAFKGSIINIFRGKFWARKNSLYLAVKYREKITSMALLILFTFKVAIF
jgi:hypothetical protein